MIVKFKNFYKLKKILQIIIIFIALIICPINVRSAELLQIKDINTIVVGDQNRSLYLSLYCIDISQNENENENAIVNHEIVEKLKLIDVNNITPFEALIKLNELVDDVN